MKELSQYFDIFYQAKQRILNLIKRIIEEKINTDKQGTPRDVADVLLNEMNNASGNQRPTVDSICNNILEMMIPGEDSVPTLMTLAVKFLSDHPSALKRLLVKLSYLQDQSVK